MGLPDGDNGGRWAGGGGMGLPDGDNGGPPAARPVGPPGPPGALPVAPPRPPRVAGGTEADPADPGRPGAPERGGAPRGAGPERLPGPAGLADGEPVGWLGRPGNGGRRAPRSVAPGAPLGVSPDRLVT